MRPLTAVGIIFIAAVGVDLGLSRLSPELWLPIPACAAVGTLGSFVSTFVIPGLWIFPRFKTRAFRSLALRALLTVLVSWFLVVEFRLQFSLPANRAMAELRNDHDYDGIGGNAAVFVGGWVVPLIITVILVGVQRSRLDGKSNDSSATCIAQQPFADTEAQVPKNEVTK